MALTDEIRRDGPGEVRSPERGEDPDHGVIVLLKGQYTASPVSTKNMLYGPMRIEYHLWPSHTQYTVL